MNIFTQKTTKLLVIFCLGLLSVTQSYGQITTNLPATSEFCQGTTMTLSVVATNATSYQWYKDGVAISGQTSSTFTKASTVLTDAGIYHVVVNGLFGTDSSVKDNVSIRQLVAITTQPTASQTLCETSPLSLSVVATGHAPLSYVWKKGSTVVGTNSSTLSIASVATTDAGTYTVSVTGSSICPTVTSSNAVVTVQAKPIITVQPTATTTICQGATLNLSVTATGAAPITYQWKKAGTAIGGATSSTYTKTNTTQAADAGVYTVDVKDNTVCAAVTSSNATVTINLKPAITAGINGTTPLCVGGALSLSATTTNNASVVWYLNGTQVSTSATYSKTAALTDAGNYTIKAVGNTGCTDTTSGNYNVVVNTATTITTQPTATQTLCEGNSLSLSVVAAGTGPFSYQWKRNGTNVGTNSSTYTVSNITQAANAGTYTVVVTGASPCASVTSSNAVVNVNLKPAITAGISGTTPVCVGTTLTLNATTTNASSTIWYLNGTQVGTGTTFTKTAVLADAGNYTVKAVANTGCVDTTSGTYAVAIQNNVQITTQPVASQTLCEGNAVVLSVAATGTGTLNYQWKKNGSNIGSNLNSIVIANAAQLTDAGTYTVDITDATSCPAVTSSNAVVVVNSKPVITSGPSGTPPFCVGSTLTLNATISNAANIVWFKNGTQVGTGATFTKTAALTDAGSYTVKAEANTGCADTTSGAYTVSINSPVTITAQPTATQTLCEGSALTLTATVTGTAPIVYQWKKDGTNVGTNSNTYTVASTTQAADAGTYTLMVSDASGCPSATSNNAVVTINLKPAITAGISGTTPLCVGNALSLSATTTNAASTIWYLNGTQVGTGSTYNVASVAATNAGNYTVKAVANTGCTDTTSANYAVVVNTPPTITTQPTATQTLCEGAALNLSVVASGTAPLSYQWKKGGTNVGTNSSTYTVASTTQAADAGTYTVEVTGASPCATATSSNAVVNINLKPAITVGISGTTPLCVGNALSLSATTTNVASTIWYLNGTQVGTGSTYSVASVAATNAGNYTVKAVANTGCTDTTSANYAVVVNTPPTITTQPTATQTLCEGNALNLSVIATGTTPLTYQWKKGGTNVGTNSSTYTVSSVTQAADAGTYTVEITGVSPCTMVTSANAVVNINLKPTLATAASGSTNICLGDALGITASASGATSVEWRKNGTTLLSGAGPALNYTLTTSTNADSGKYYFVAQGTTPCSNVILDSITVKINQPVVITTQPTATQTLCEGNTLTLSVVATGQAPLTYVWKKNGSIVPGSTATYTKTGIVQASDSGTYTVEITGAVVCPSVTSANAVVNINIKPSITTLPSGTTPLCVGNTINLTAAASNMASVEWRKLGAQIGTSTTFTKTATVSDSGIYTFVAKANPGCTDSMNTFTLVVNTPPTITTQPRDTTICEGNTISLSVVATGTTPFTYQWKKNGANIPVTTSSFTVANATQALAQGTYSVDITGASPCAVVSSNVATVVVNKKPIPTTPTGLTDLCIGDPINLTASATNMDSIEWYRGTTKVGIGTSFSKAVSVITDSGNYYIKAKAMKGCIDSNSAMVNVKLKTPATITVEPIATQTLCEGSKLKLTVTATSAGTLSYQWRRNGVNVSGATLDSLVIASTVQATDSGTYTCVVTSSGTCPSTDTSANAVVIINKKPTITAALSGTNNICLGSALNLTATTANTSSIELKRGTTVVSTSLPYNVAAAAYADSGNYTLVAKALTACMDSTSAAYNVKVNIPVTITTQPTATQTLCEGNNLALSVVATGQAPLTYVWKKTGSTVGSSLPNYTKSGVTQAADSGTYTVSVTGSSACPTVISNNALVNINKKPVITTGIAGTNVLCLGDSLGLTVAASNISGIDWKKGTVTVGTGTLFTKKPTVAGDAGNYNIVAKALPGCVDSISGTYTVTINQPVSIFIPPVAQTKCEGDSLLVGVVANGTGPFTYQWRKNGTLISGAANASIFRKGNITQADSGFYSVIVTGASPCPSVLSDSAKVTINKKPTLTGIAGPNNVCLGSALSLSTTYANGTDIEWYKDGVFQFNGFNSYDLFSTTYPDSGNYSVKIKALPGCIDTTTPNFVVKVKKPVTITTQPLATQTLCVGGTISLSTVATGEAPLTFQWKKNTVAIAGETNASYSKPSVAVTDSGNYTVSITGSTACPTVTSTIARVNVNPKAVINSQPVAVSNNICLGDSIRMSGAASNYSSIEWRRNGTLVGTGTFYRKSVSTMADTGTYTMVVKGLSPCADTISSSITMTINNPVVITTQPTATQTLCEGSPLKLKVVATGTGTLTYQWKKNGTSIGGATLDSLVKASVTQSADTGNYTVAVSGISVCPTVTSSIARVNVNPQPKITTQPNGVNNICLGDSIKLSAVAINTSSIEWRKNGTLIGTGSSYFKLTSALTDTGNYTIVAKGNTPCMDSTSLPIYVTVNKPVTITTQPTATQTLCEGSTLKLKVVATGTGTLTYQWKKNGTSISAATLDSFEKMAITQAADTGNYTVAVSGVSVCPTVTSSIARVNINLQPKITTQPNGVNNICLGDSIKLTAAASNTSSIEWRRNGTLIGTGTSYFKLASALTDSGNYTIVAKGISPCMDSTSLPIYMTVNSPVVITTQPTASQTLCEGNTLNLKVVATGSGTLTYQWFNNGTTLSGATLDSFEKMAITQAADTGNYTVAVSGVSVCPTVASSVARVDINLKPVLASAPMGTSQVCLDSMINITSSATNVAGIEWYQNGALVSSTTDYNVPMAAYTDSGVYKYKALALQGCIDTFSDSFVVKVNTPITITTQPTATQTLCEGNTINLKVVAAGTGPYTYQWKFNGVDIAGATADSFVKSGITTADAGSYSVQVSGSSVCYSVLSANATVIINLKPVITQNPLTSSVLCAGNPLTLTSGSNNKALVTWYKDGVSVGTGDNYNVAASSTADAGLYKFKLTALTSCVDTMSDTFRVFITNPVTITTQPTATQTLCKGNVLNLNVVASSNTPLTYQWKKDGNQITGETDSFITISSVDISDFGLYTVDVKDANSICPTVTSSTGSVNVNLPPVINTQPTGSSPVCEGSKIKITTSVDNYTSIDWYKNNNFLLTSDSFVKLNAAFSDSGNYKILVKALPGCRDTLLDTVFVQNVSKGTSIVSHPMSTSLLDSIGMSYVMRVTAAGTGPFTYQWYKNNVAILGATADSFKIYTYIGANDAGSYHVAVSGQAPCVSTVLSNVAVISTTKCPIITVQPSPDSVTACIGGVLNLEVAALGTSGYQWTKNGIAIAGAIFPRYTVSSVTGTENGDYRCQFLSSVPGCTQPFSRIVKVKTATAPVITIQPVPNKICNASSHVLKVSTSNADTFQWYLGGTAIAGANKDTFAVSSIGANDALYSVAVNNKYCTPLMSDTVNVKKVNPANQVVLTPVTYFDLIEQCTDTQGWTYYSNDVKHDEFLLAIKKRGNTVTFRPDIEVLPSIYEISANNVERRGALFGNRLFNIDVETGNVDSTPYDVKFYYATSEYTTMVGRFGDIRASLGDTFTTSRALNSPSFITSTQAPFTNSLLSSIVIPFNFENTIVSLQDLGTDNNIKYVVIKDLVAKNGGGCMFYDYFKKRYASSIVNQSNDNIDIKLYPVPSMGDITLEVNNEILKNVSIIITDVTGKVVYESIERHATTVTKHNLDLNHLSNGTYNINVTNGESTNNGRFIIVR